MIILCISKKEKIFSGYFNKSGDFNKRDVCIELGIEVLYFFYKGKCRWIYYVERDNGEYYY